MELNYKKGLWLGFEPALNKYYSTRNKVQTLIWVLTEKNNYENEYAQNLLHLTNILNDCLKLKENQKPSTLDETLSSLSFYIKEKSEFMLEETKKINQQIIKELCELTALQNDKTKELKSIIDIYPKIFIESYYKLKSLKATYFKRASDSEILIQQNLEWKKEKNAQKNRKKISERDNQQIKAIESLKEAEKAYRDFLPLMNKERENFITKTEEVLNSFEKMENEIFTILKEKLEEYLKEQTSINRSITGGSIDLSNKLKKLSFTTDNQNFLRDNQTFLTPPTVFTFAQYHPQSIRNLNSTEEYSKVLARETLSTLKTLLTLVQQFQKEENEEQTKNFEFLEESILNIIEEKEVNLTKIKDLLKTQIYREFFLGYLNNIRKEGVISLKKKSFDSLCDLFAYLLKLAQQNNDGLCLNSILILCQVFCLGESKSSTIKNSIVDNKIWKDSNVWISIITATIINELSEFKEYPTYINETQKERDTRKHSVVFGKLVSFFFLMKEFNIPNNEIMNILTLFSTKYSVGLEEITKFEASQDIINEEIMNKNIQSESTETIIKMK